MKWVVVASGAAVLGIALFVLQQRSPDSLPGAGLATAPPPISAAPAAPAPRAPVPAADPRPPIVLGGLVYQGKDNPQSQALLSVEGNPLQVFRAGDRVVAGWSLQSIAADHAIVSDGVSTARLDVVRTASARSAASADKPAALAKDEPLPGFTAGPPPRMAVSDAAASERNRRLLQSMQEKRTAR
ncbi:MAG: hypothetical protein JWQ07_1422 [Ramlibacter sp.]|nr:hypothetical protein [Ramlibacter sp.]